VRHVDKAFVDGLIAGPHELTECDGARFEPETSGVGYKLQRATSSTLAYKLGLRTSDIILKVNNQTLNTFGQAATRLGALYLAGGTSTFTVQFKRSGVTQSLSYVVDP